MISEPKGLSPLPTACEAGVAALHEHIYPLLDSKRVAICCSFDEESALDRSQGAGLKGRVTDLETAETFEIHGFPRISDSDPTTWSGTIAVRVAFDSQRVQ